MCLIYKTLNTSADNGLKFILPHYQMRARKLNKETSVITIEVHLRYRSLQALATVKSTAQSRYTCEVNANELEIMRLPSAEKQILS